MTEKTIGEQLTTAREKMHLSLDDVAQALHIRSSYLKSIEENHLNELPSRTQARGFIRMYASHVGLDSHELLQEQEPIPENSPQTESTLPAANIAQTPEGEIPKIEKKKRSSKIQTFVPAPNLGSLPLQTDRYLLIMKQIGDELIARRRKLALSLEDIENHTHIRKAYLDAIENGKIDELPSTIQGRGLLSNYAEFLDLDPDPLLVRFAEALQSKVKPVHEGILESPQAEPEKPKRFWLLVKKYFTLDLVIGGGLILTLFFFVFWGAAQLIRSNAQLNSPTSSESTKLTSETLPSSGTLANLGVPDATIISDPSFVTTESTASGSPPSPAASQSIFGSGTLQVHVIATQSAFVKVVADGNQIFFDRVISGNAYQFSAATRIELITGNAAALQVTFNGSSLGILGSMGQVVDLIFNSAGVLTATPIFTPSPTTSPTSTTTPIQTATPTVLQPTLTPLVPTSKP